MRVGAQQRRIQTSFPSRGARQTLFTGTRKAGIPQQNNKRWTCAGPSGLAAPAQQPLDWSSDSCRCDRPCLVPGLPALSALRQRARERALTSAAPRGNNGDTPQCDSRRQEQTQTQELSIPPLRQTCRGLRMWRRNSLSLCLRFINMS